MVANKAVFNFCVRYLISRTERYNTCKQASGCQTNHKTSYDKQGCGICNLCSVERERHSTTLPTLGNKFFTCQNCSGGYTP